ncbi:hypothetical protein [Colwellia psychrerythraea]|uniref:Phosphate ABC transporter substrate-binding protein n=1 Tax=Colwellia psychrerythraea TaxID=28229 RepID=A0A099L420_COLPS|nr:hypothetical protein [Colwellia psychrerythraea]KGJ97596.1 hypothetical protein GAB14E_1185 [Colwellia psychrerythraea]
MTKFIRTLTFLICTLLSISVHAQESLAVVVNKENPVDELSRSELIDLFMGKYVAFPNDEKAIPVELKGEHEIKIEFYQNLVGLPLSRVNAYWSRLRFTGRKRSAVFQSNESDLIAFIIANEQAIGYLPESQITADLKVVYILNE